MALDALPAAARLAWREAQQTVIYLPLREGAPPAEALCAALRERGPSLLFLRRLRQLGWSDEATGESLRLRRVQQPSASEDAGQGGARDGVEEWSVTVEELEYSHEGGPQPQAWARRYLRCAAVLSVPPMHAASASGPTTEIVLALPLPEAERAANAGGADGGRHSDGVCQVFCFLPVRDVGLRFALHAEFSLVTNRDDVHDSAWNRWLRDSAARLFVAAVAAQPPDACVPALAFLPSGLRSPEPFWQLFVDGAVRELRDSPLAVLHSESGELCPLRMLLRRPGCVSKRLLPNQELKRITGGKQFAAATRDGAEEASLAALGLPEFGLRELAGCIHASSSTQSLAQAWPMLELYSTLYELLKQAGAREAGGIQAAAHSVRSLRIFPLNKSKEVTSCDAGPIFRSLASRDEAALDALGTTLRLLDSSLAERLWEAGAQGAQKLLDVLGIVKVTSADLVQLVLKEHEELLMGVTAGPGTRQLLDAVTVDGATLRMERFREQLRLLRRHAEHVPKNPMPVLAVGSDKLRPLPDLRLKALLGGLLVVHDDSHEPERLLDVFGPFSPDRLQRKILSQDEVLERLRDEQFMRERLGTERADGTFRAADDSITELQLGSLLAAAAEPQLFQYVLSELMAHSTCLPRIEVSATPVLDPIDVSLSSSFLDNAFGAKSTFAGAQLLCIDPPLPVEREAHQAARELLRDLGVAVDVSVTTVLHALRVQQSDEMRQVDGHRADSLDRADSLRKIEVRQQPLLSWLSNYLMAASEDRDSAQQEVRKAFFGDGALHLFELTADGTRRDLRVMPPGTFAICRWYEFEPASWLSDVLRLWNLADAYEGARHLLVDVLQVQCTFDLEELCNALDLLSDFVMDGEIDGTEIPFSEINYIDDYFEHDLHGSTVRPSASTDIWRAIKAKYPFDEGRDATDVQRIGILRLLQNNVETLLSVCTHAYEQLAAALGDDASAVDADFFDRRRILVPLGAIGTVGARFSTSEDVYWFAATADSAELAAACGLHALAPHYPNALRRFFVTLLHVPERPSPSTSRLLEAIHTLAASPPTESTARVVAECQRVCSRHSNRAELSPPSTGAHPPPAPLAPSQLLSQRDLSGLEEVSGEISHGCPRHGPGCRHPACHALGELFGSRATVCGVAGGGGGVTLADLGLTASDPRDSLERARRSIEQALSLGRRHAQHDLRRAAAGEGAHEAHDECAPERRTFAISH